MCIRDRYRSCINSNRKYRIIMTEKAQEQTKLQKLTKVLKDLEVKYQNFKKDRVELLKFAETILPPSEEAAAQVKAEPGKVDCKVLMKLFKATEIQNNKLKEELEILRKNERLMQEKLSQMEMQIKKQVNEEGNILLAKIRSIGSSNQLPAVNNSSLVESLEEKMRSQEKLISSLKSQLLSNASPSIVPKLKIREVGIQVESAVPQTTEDSESLKKKILELQQALESLQYEHNVNSRIAP
eukprot:TRINITY_DN3514_c0_g1_i12.p2 TRINITY_DN3514_c0_g1~~TRINITY_DN3514_c0_g1_i12.p2  ORF type:complete len:240 (-),score=72.12 TRINITY_DN3514_c0_g1_i12:810-1529(-)